ncbi:MAG TPA: large conductance mechanosensitive channel protein MscL [Acholeplasmataceae bacterium]|nr:large conductance mechanosensitive channel protein MscL [Acholeplasmataceae bacterium]
MKQFFKEFKAFISKGNALDLAIGLVLGTAFNNIVNSLVNDMIMPLFSLFGGRSMSAWFFVLRGTQTYNESLGTYVFSEDAIVLYYGQFLNSILDFFIIGLSIFLALKILKKMDHTLDEIKDKIHHDKRDKNNESI